MPPILREKGVARKALNKLKGVESSNVKAGGDQPHPGPQPAPDHVETEDKQQELLGYGDEKARNWQNPLEPNVPARRRFIVQLAVALHSYGSTASRTEFLIDKAANRLDIETNIAVFPSLILLSFPGTDEYNLSRHVNDPGLRKKSRKSSQRSSQNSNASRKEMHMLTVESGLDVDKLGHVDELTNRVGRAGTPFPEAYRRLKYILNSPPYFDNYVRLFGFAISGATSAPLFFDGSLWDAVFCSIFGTAVGVLDMIAADYARFGNILEFSGAVLIAFLSRCCILYFKSLSLCYVALTLGSLSQLFPGMSLTLGANEMIAKSRVTGSAEIVCGLYTSMQLGFGLAVGENLVWWAGEAPSNGTCPAINRSPLWKLIWFLGYAVGSNILLMARIEQWPGMTITTLVGYLVSSATNPGLSATTSSAISAFAVGITGNTYSYFTGTMPLAMIISGINLLVPGGIGVLGVASLVKKNNTTTGVGFVFEMTVVALSLTIGLLIAKLAMPQAMQVTRPMKFGKRNLPSLMGDSEEMVVKHYSSSSDSDTGDMAL